MKKNKKIKRKKRRLIRKILLTILVAIVIASCIFAYKVKRNGGGISGILATAVGHDELTKKNLGEFRCLLLGISTDQDGVNLTDTIIVASYNPNTQKATLLSIPRDTYTGKDTTRATGYEKINALYGRKKRADETLKAVNEITGLNIEYYAVIRTEALIKLVDVIGGVTYNVPIDMYYTDEGQDLIIDLKKGEQLLDGAKAEQLLRFRKNNNGTSYPAEYGDNDIGRMRTQREFIMQVIKQTMKIGNIFKIGQIIDVAKENLETNIDLEVLKDYIPYAVEFNTSDILTETLPGEVPDYRKTNNCSIFVYNKKETKELVNKLFYNRDKTEEELEEEGNTITEKSKINVEILNGTNEKTKLEEVVKKLKDEGYKVGKQENLNTTSKTVIIKDKDVGTKIADNIKEILGTGITQTSENTGESINVTVIIGNDYN
ncbi:MAG: LCP family protein [Clostridia bacterium]|nr:LCP family protein [Clostridia bacterium]